MNVCIDCGSRHANITERCAECLEKRIRKGTQIRQNVALDAADLDQLVGVAGAFVEDVAFGRITPESLRDYSNLFLNLISNAATARNALARLFEAHGLRVARDHRIAPHCYTCTCYSKRGAEPELPRSPT